MLVLTRLLIISNRLSQYARFSTCLMNVVELFYFLGFIGSALAGGWLLGRHFGTLGGCIGAGLGLICWGGFVWGINLLVNKLDKLYPGRPTCRRGKCNAKDYAFRGLKDGCVQLQCRCGDNYISSANRFMAVDEAGIVHPFMTRKHMFAHWQKDDSTQRS